MCISHGKSYKLIETVSILSFFTMLQPTGTKKRPVPLPGPAACSGRRTNNGYAAGSAGDVSFCGARVSKSPATTAVKGATVTRPKLPTSVCKISLATYL